MSSSRVRTVVGSAMAALVVAGLSLAIPSVSSATSLAPGGSKVICTAGRVISLVNNHTGKVTITGTGTGKDGATCSIKITGKWKANSILAPESIDASGNVVNGAFNRIALKSTTFSGSMSGKISSVKSVKMTWIIGVTVAYPPLTQDVIVEFF